MTTLKTVQAAEANPKLITDILEKDGCVVMANLLDKEQIKRLKEEMESGFDKVDVCQGNFFGFSTKRMSSVLAKSEMSRDMVTHPLVTAAMDHFLLKSCRQYQINLTQAIKIYPGEPAQIIHTDDLMFPFEMADPAAQKMINCMWAVDDFTETNGATNLVPGSHLWPRDRQPEPHEIVQGIMPAGSVLIYFGRLLHGGGANRSDASRTGLVLSYCLGWLRQAENNYLALPLDLVRGFSPQLQKLVGYFVHEPNLGALEGRDPIELLQKGELSARFQEFIPEEFHEAMQEYRKKALGQAA